MKQKEDLTRYISTIHQKEKRFFKCNQWCSTVNHFSSLIFKYLLFSILKQRIWPSSSFKDARQHLTTSIEGTKDIDDVLFKLQEMFTWVKSNWALNDDYSQRIKETARKRCGSRFFYLLMFLLRFLSLHFIHGCIDIQRCIAVIFYTFNHKWDTAYTGTHFRRLTHFRVSSDIANTIREDGS